MSSQHPRQTAAITEHAHGLLAQGRADEALVFYRRALLLDPTSTTALANLSKAFFTSTPAETLQQRISRLFGRSRIDRSVGALLHARLATFQWEYYDEIRNFILESIAADRAATAPLWLLAIADSTAAQYSCAREFANSTFPPTPAAFHGRDIGKLRIAYISGDFGSHAVSVLMAGVLEQHDRERFEVIGASLRPTDSSFLGKRVRAAFDRFIDCSTRSDSEVAALLRANEVHIAVDLMGFTAGARTAIFAQRCAPLQVNYLGYPGTMGATFMDYLLGDRFAIPHEQRHYYAERIVYLPGCFQANDRSRPRTVPVARVLCGLPPGGVVLCCFNSPFKVNPPMCDVWCRVLARTPDCVLWVVAAGTAEQDNFRKEVARRGIDARRIFFSPRVSYEDYLSRMQTADLFLDTFPFNGGTTVADALWCGLPVLTCTGEALASRMAGSLLRSLGLPELVTGNLRDYEAQAIRLANDPVLRADLRGRLADGRDRGAVYDAPRFCRNLEVAYEIMWERHRRGEPPETFSIRPDDWEEATNARSALDPTGIDNA